MEQHEARRHQHSPPRRDRPAAGQEARLPRPAEAAVSDPDSDYWSAMEAAGLTSARGPARAATRAPARPAVRIPERPAPPPAREKEPERERERADAADDRAAAEPYAPRPEPDEDPYAETDGAETSTVYRAGRRRGLLAPLGALLRRMPAPKLTGFGCWLLATLALFAFGCLDTLLLGGSQTAYGVFFVLVGVGAALWVRPYDLITAPVSLPIAFAVGTLPIQRGSGGFGGLLIGVFTVLALNAGWLYAGTLVCALLTLVRKTVLIVRRRASRPASRPQGRSRPGERAADREPRQAEPGSRPQQMARQSERRAQPSRRPRSPHCSEAAPARSRP